MDIAGCIAIVLAVYYAVNVNNTAAVPFEELVKGVNWSLILMFATVAPLTVAMQNEEAGIMAYITEVMTNSFGDMSPTVFILLIVFMGSCLTQFCSNVAVLLITLPLMYTFGVQLGVSPFVITVLASYTLNIAFCTPAASGQAALLYSDEKWIGRNTAFKQGMVIFVINIIVTVIAVFLGNIFM